MNPSSRLLRRSAIALALLLTAQAAWAQTWTIMVYGHADHNLTPGYAEDLLEMQVAGSTSTFNIVNQTDFNTKIEDQVLGAITSELLLGTHRFLIRQDNSEDFFNQDPVETLPEMNFDDPQVLQDFITWAMQHYPADRYGLVYWDHGGQWYGFGGDSQDGTVAQPGIITPAQVRAATTAAMATAGRTKLDFIAFDTCLMAGVEVLPYFADISDVYIACAEVDFGDGWDYTGTLNWLKAFPGAPMTTFGLAETYYYTEHHLEGAADQQLRMHAAFDSSKVPAVITAWRNLTAALLAADEQELYARLRVRLNQYSLGDLGNPAPQKWADLGEFANYLASVAQSPALRSAAATMAQTIRASIVGLSAGAMRDQGFGLSVYYPITGRTGRASDDTYRALAPVTASGWGNYLDRVATQSQKEAPKVIQPGNDAIYQDAAGPTSSNTVQIAQTQDFDNLETLLIRNGFEFGSLGYVNHGGAGAFGGTDTFSIFWDGTRPTLTTTAGGPAAYLAFYQVDEGDDDEELAMAGKDEHLYISYAQYQVGTDTPEQIIITILPDGAGGGVLGGLLVTNPDDPTMAPRQIKAVPGAKITPIYKRWGGTDFMTSQVSITVPTAASGDALKIGLARMPKGLYNAQVRPFNIYGVVNSAAYLLFGVD